VPCDDAETIALGRKKVLLRILARQAVRELGIAIGPHEVQRMSDALRRLTRLTCRTDMLQWLADCNLSTEQYQGLLQDWAGCEALEKHFHAEIEHLLPGQLALHTMRAAAQTQE
jgi:hypothetical protein